MLINFKMRNDIDELESLNSSVPVCCLHWAIGCAKILYEFNSINPLVMALCFANAWLNK